MAKKEIFVNRKLKNKTPTWPYLGNIFPLDKYFFFFFEYGTVLFSHALTQPSLLHANKLAAILSPKYSRSCASHLIAPDFIT